MAKSLYIPYGSDKTKAFVKWASSRENLYIPYGSDKTKIENESIHEERTLYIPYGSDKTIYGFIPVWTLPRFISHMVQIKPIQ